MALYCRLCAELKVADELTASIDDPKLRIEEKLLACCRWHQYGNSTNANFPNGICYSCCEKLENCWLFNETVAKAQVKLQEIFGDNTELIVIKDEAHTEDDEFSPVDVVVDIFVEPLKLSTGANDDEKPLVDAAADDTFDEKKSRISHECDECAKSFTTAYNLTVSICLI